MRLWVCFSANHRLTDTIIRDGEIIEALALSCPPPAPLHDLASHTWLEFEREDGTLRGIEAVLPVVRSFDPAEKRTQTVRRYRTDATDEQIDTAYRVAARLVGHLYDWLGLLCVSLHIVARRFTVERFRASRHLAVYCAELVTLVLRAAGLAFLGTLAPDNVTPNNAEGECIRLGWPRDPYSEVA